MLSECSRCADVRQEVTEAATRVGHFHESFERAAQDFTTPEQYKVYVDSGRDPTTLPPGVAVEAAWEAGYAAHDVMDFSRRGANMMTVARLIAFLNAP